MAWKYHKNYYARISYMKILKVWRKEEVQSWYNSRTENKVLGKSTFSGYFWNRFRKFCILQLNLFPWHFRFWKSILRSHPLVGLEWTDRELKEVNKWNTSFVRNKGTNEIKLTWKMNTLIEITCMYVQIAAFILI